MNVHVSENYDFAMHITLKIQPILAPVATSFLVIN